MVWRRRPLRSMLATTAALALLCSCSPPGSGPTSACPDDDAGPSPSGETLTLDLTSTYHSGAGIGGDVTVTSMLSSLRDGGPLETAGRCTRGDITLYATSPAVPNQPGRIPEGHLDLTTGGGEGAIELVENTTWNRENDPGNGMGEFRGFTGWYVAFADPAPGTYRWSSDVTWADPRTNDDVGDGRVDFVLVATG